MLTASHYFKSAIIIYIVRSFNTEAAEWMFIFVKEKVNLILKKRCEVRRILLEKKNYNISRKSQMISCLYIELFPVDHYYCCAI